MINLNNLIADPIIQALGWTLIHSLWQGIIVAIILSFVLSLLWKESANARYLSAISAMVILLGSLVGTFAYQYQIRSEIGLDQANSYTTQIILFEEIIDETGNDTHYFWESAWVLELEERLQQNMPILVLCWLIGSLAFTLRFVGGYLYLYRLTHHQLTPLSQSWNTKIKDLSKQMGLRKIVRVFESALVDEPLTLRHFKPIILIPAGLASGLHPDQLEAIFMHEMAHIRRADYLINFDPVISRNRSFLSSCSLVDIRPDPSSEGRIM